MSVNLRAEFAEARFHLHTGVSSVVYGVASNGVGETDEYATVEDLKAKFAVHASARSVYLKRELESCAWS